MNSQLRDRHDLLPTHYLTNAFATTCKNGASEKRIRIRRRRSGRLLILQTAKGKSSCRIDNFTHRHMRTDRQTDTPLIQLQTTQRVLDRS